MVRAGIFIGVDKTGNLHKLNDAAAGAARMHEWALAQGMDPAQARLITDAGGQRVTPDHVYDAIKEIIDGPGADQLIVYFAGHGVNINRSEHWLLTDAPVRTSAAVNVSGSVELARYCGIQHVVVISDACRVAPDGIQAQNVRGVDVFPNDAASDRAKPVDQFFACFLGRTAAELRDPADAAGTFCALYTGALLDALGGKLPEVLKPGQDAADPYRYVWPRDLQEKLEAEVARRVKDLGLQNRVNQNPDAIITSHDKWLSRVQAVARNVAKPRFGMRDPGEARPRQAPPPPPLTVPGLTRTLVRSAASGDYTRLYEHLRTARDAALPGAGELARTVDRVSAPFGPDHFETRCGIKVRGARIAGFYAPHARGDLLDPETLRIHSVDRGASVLLEFEGGFGTVIPALDGFLAALTFEEGELVDVAYEPSANTDRWYRSQHTLEPMRALRAVAAAAARHGRFRLEGEDAAQVARQMQQMKGADPAFAIYAAYAYHDLQQIDRLREMSDFLRADTGVTFFDLAMLGRALTDRPLRPDVPVLPFTPLLSQGWALVKAHRVRLHPALEGIEGTLRDSLWSLYDAAGLARLREALHSGDVR